MNDASSKIKWAMGLKPNLGNLPGTQPGKDIVQLSTWNLLSLFRGDKYAASVSSDMEEKHASLEERL